MCDRSDEDIIKDYGSGNQEGIEVIFTRYKSRILNFSLRILGNRADAEDVTGEVFLTLFSGRYTLTPGAKFSTWLFTVARNSCISRIRTRKKSASMWFSNKGSHTESQWEVADNQDTANDALVKRETSQAVKTAIMNLPYEQREAIVLREYDQFSYDQISQVLNCSLEKTKVLIYRARENLRQSLSSFRDEGENDGS